MNMKLLLLLNIVCAGQLIHAMDQKELQAVTTTVKTCEPACKDDIDFEVRGIKKIILAHICEFQKMYGKRNELTKKVDEQFGDATQIISLSAALSKNATQLQKKYAWLHKKFGCEKKTEKKTFGPDVTTYNFPPYDPEQTPEAWLSSLSAEQVQHIATTMKITSKLNFNL